MGAELGEVAKAGVVVMAKVVGSVGALVATDRLLAVMCVVMTEVGEVTCGRGVLKTGS